MENKIDLGVLWYRVIIYKNNEIEDDNYSNQNFFIARNCFTYDGNDLSINPVHVIELDLELELDFTYDWKLLKLRRFPKMFYVDGKC